MFGVYIAQTNKDHSLRSAVRRTTGQRETDAQADAQTNRQTDASLTQGECAREPARPAVGPSPASDWAPVAQRAVRSE